MKTEGPPIERAHTDQFRLLVETVKDYAIFLLDPKGNVISWNAGAERIKGYTADEIIGRHFSAFYPAHVASSGKPDNELRIAASTGRYEEEGWRIRKDGSRFWASVVITALHDPNGELVGFAKVTRDLTEQKKAEEERTALAAASEAIRLRDEFISIAAHELRTPMTSAKIAAQLLRRSFRSDEATAAQRNALEALDRQVSRLGHLVAQLLDTVRIEAGVVRPERLETDLVELVREEIDQWRALNEREIVLSAPTTVVARVDPLRITQVLTNLIENATKYGGDGIIEVGISRTPQTAIVTVRDHGPGIDPKDRARLFERFYQANPGRSGMGLGLFITRQIVELHGGRIYAEFPDDGGTRFVVSLPLA